MTHLEEELRAAVVVYVLNKDGSPLMPSRRIGHIRRLLDTGKARIISHVPFMIQLRYQSEGITQNLFMGNDPGRTNIGDAVINDKGEVVYRDHITTRNKEVPKLMAERSQHRHASRNGEHQARKRLAKKHGTLMQTENHQKERMLSGYEKPVVVKDITNTEARFNNRVRPDGWITPTVRQLVETHISDVKQKMKLMPITDVCIELNEFSFMRMEDGTCVGSDFQNGRLKGYKSIKDYIAARQGGTCALCGRPIEQYHHIVPRHEYGSNLPENIIGLCQEHHEAVHTGKVKLNVPGIRKKYGALSVLNQAIPFIYDELVQMFGKEHVHLVSGWQTKDYYESHHLGKDHNTDAVCIACLGMGIELSDRPMPKCWEIQQFRRHNRALINCQTERSYYLPEDLKHPVCKNRHKRFEQKCDSLEEFRLKHPEDISRLIVKKSKRSYNNPKRIMPGSVFCFQGTWHVLNGSLTNGKYIRAYGDSETNYPAAQCTLKKAGGLVYVC